MLSFLREQAGNIGDQKTTAAGKGPGAAEDASGQAYFTVASKSDKVRKSTALIAVLFGIGLVCLWFMIQKSKPQGASAATSAGDEQQIEAAIGRLTGVSSEMLGRMDHIVKKFYEFSDVPQVGVDELVKNPFEFEQYLANLRAKTVAPEPPKQEPVNVEAILQQQHAQRAQRAKQEASTLKLTSIMKSSQGDCCMIDDKILLEGDSIKSFKVTRISGNSVELAWNGDTGDAGAQTKADDLTVVLKLAQ